MADTGEPEGWRVRQRPAMIGAVLTPLVLIVLLLAAGYFYNTHLRPAARPHVSPFPAPGIESYIHDGARDPHRPLSRPIPDPAIARAQHAIAAEGLPGWSPPK